MASVNGEINEIMGPFLPNVSCKKHSNTEPALC